MGRTVKSIVMLFLILALIYWQQSSIAETAGVVSEAGSHVKEYAIC